MRGGHQRQRHGRSAAGSRQSTPQPASPATPGQGFGVGLRAVAGLFECQQLAHQRFGAWAEVRAGPLGQGAPAFVRPGRHAQAVQALRQVALHGRPGRRARPTPPQQRQRARRERRAAAGQHLQQGRGLCGGHAEHLHQLRLLPQAVAGDPVPPLPGQEFTPAAVGLGPAGVQRPERAQEQARWRAQRRAVLDPFGRDRGRRIDAQPAFAGLPDLGPGVGVALAHDPPSVHGRRIGALVAGDNARRHVQRAHQHDEGGGVVLAEAAAAVEPELVDGVVAVGTRVERVGVATGGDAFENLRRQHAGVGQGEPWVLPHLCGERQRARVAAWRQVDVVAQRDGARLEAVAGDQRGLRPHLHHPLGGATPPPGQVAALLPPGGGSRGADGQRARGQFEQGQHR